VDDQAAGIVAVLLLVTLKRGARQAEGVGGGEIRLPVGLVLQGRPALQDQPFAALVEKLRRARLQRRAREPSKKLTPMNVADNSRWSRTMRQGVQPAL
jgi:hypothetical protein